MNTCEPVVATIVNLGMALLRPGVLLLCGWAVKFFV